MIKHTSKFQAKLSSAFAGAMTPTLPFLAAYFLIRGFSKDENAIPEGTIVFVSIIPLTMMLGLGVLSAPLLGWWSILAAVAGTSALGAAAMVALSAQDSSTAH